MNRTKVVFALLLALCAAAGRADPAFDFHSGPCSFASPASGSLGPVKCRSLAGADLPLPSASTLGGVESIAPVSHQFVTSISTSGVPSLAQPAAADISGLSTTISAALATALPSATTSKLYGGSGSAGLASVVTIGGNLSLSGGTLSAIPSGGFGAVQYNTGGTAFSGAGVFITGFSQMTLGQAGSALGSLVFDNLTSGSIQLQAPTGALGSAILTLPDATDTLVGQSTTDTLANKTLTSPVINGAITGTGLTNYFAAPAPIGITTPNTGAFTSLVFSGSATGNTASEFLNRYAVDSFGQSLTFQKSRNATVGSTALVQSGDTLGLVSFGGADGSTFKTAASIYATVEGTASSGIVPGRLHFQTANSSGTLQEDGFFSASGVLSVSSGLANSVTLAGSANNPTVGISGGSALGIPNSLVVGAGAGTAANGSGGNAALGVLGTSGSPMEFYSSSGATDQKTWDFGPGANSTIFRLRALNDAYTFATTAYQITAGTTFNIAKQDWYTSTTAGTAVQGMELNTSGLTVGNGTYSSFQAVAPGPNLWANSWQASGNIAGSGPTLGAVGTDTNIAAVFQAKGTSSLFFETGSGARIQFAVLDNASGSDYLTVTSGASSGLLSTNAGALDITSATGIVYHPGSLQIGNSGGATTTTGELAFAKITATATAPGAGSLKIEAVAGTTGGTCKIIAYAGTSTTAVTLVDNVGSGC